MASLAVFTMVSLILAPVVCGQYSLDHVLMTSLVVFTMVSQILAPVGCGQCSLDNVLMILLVVFTMVSIYSTSRENSGALISS